jgi:hypothetical protein
MLLPSHHKEVFKAPNWVLPIGLFGIVNFILNCWFLFPRFQEERIYFWFSEFYDSLLLPSLMFFPIGMIFVVLWVTRFIQNLPARIMVIAIGFILTLLLCVPAFGTAVFLSTLRVVGKVKQEQHYYYLVKHYDDWAPNYWFCTSDIIGFSGSCRLIGWSGFDNDPRIFIDPHTNFVTVESEKPSFIWRNSVPPTCVNINDDDFVGGCVP